jgi:hypothetical protein
MEKTITNAIIKMINTEYPNGLARKRFSGGSTNNVGEPDITASVCGIRVEIEVKQPGKKPSKLQLSRLSRLQKKGCIAFWADSKSSAKAQLDQGLVEWQPGGLEAYLAGLSGRFAA